MRKELRYTEERTKGHQMAKAKGKRNQECVKGND